METILKKLLQNDNWTVQEATKELREVLKSPEAVGWLCETLCTANEAEVRQYSAVVLRKKLSHSKYWTELNLNAKTHVKNVLMEKLVSEPEKSVKNGIVRIMGVIVKHELPSFAWPELFHFLQHTTTSNEQDEKELGFYTLSILLEVAEDQLSNHATSFINLFSNTLVSLQDPASPIGYFIILCMINLMPTIHNSKELSNTCIEIFPRVINCIKAMSTKRVDRASEAMDFFYNLVEPTIGRSKKGDGESSEGISPNPFLTQRIIKPMVKLCLEFVEEKSSSEELKMKSLNLICSLVALKLKTMEKIDVITSVVSTVFKVMSLPPAIEDEDEDYFSSNSEEDTLLTCACETLDTMALYLKAELFVPPLMEHIQPALSGNNPYSRRAAYLSLGILAQGCEEYIKENRMAELVEVVYKGSMEPNSLIRNAALFALGQFAEYLQPEISVYSNELMPLIVNLVNDIVTRGTIKEGQDKDSSPYSGVERILYAVDKFADNLEESLVPYVPQLISYLLILTTDKYPVHTRELGINTIGSIAGAVKEEILPYFSEIMAKLNGFLTQEQDPETSCLQVESIDALGALARALGPVHFRPFAADAIDLGTRTLESTEDPDIKKSIYGLLASVSTVLKEEMAPVLPSIVQHIMKSLKNEEGFSNPLKDDEEEAFPLSDSESEEGESDVHQGDYSDFAGYGVENDFIEEKEESCFALKELAANTGAAFAPFLQTSFEELFKLLSFPNEDVRQAAVEAIFQVLISVGKMSDSSEGSAVYQYLLERLMGKAALMVRADEEREVVLRILEGFNESLKELKEKVAGHITVKDAIISCIQDVISSRTEAQSFIDDGEEDEELMEAAGDLVPALGRAMSHKQFASHFASLLPLFTDRMYNASEDEASRSSSIGMLAECMEGLGPCIDGYLNTLLPFLLCQTSNSNANIRNNAIYALGEMAYHGKETLYSHYPEILNALSRVMPNEKNSKVLDNICGAIARLILSNPQGVPLEQVLPVYLNALPLREDFSENKWVIGSLSHLYTLGNPILQQHLVSVIKLCALLVQDKSTVQETKSLAINLIQMCRRDFPEECQRAASQLSPETLSLLETACSES